MNGTSTLFVQADSARDSRRNGTEVWLNLTRSGIVWRRTRRGAAQLVLGHQERAPA